MPEWERAGGTSSLDALAVAPTSLGSLFAPSSDAPATASVAPTAHAATATVADEDEPIVVPPLVQLRRTYLMFEREDGIVLIDQHSAHERVLYEEFMGALQGADDGFQSEVKTELRRLQDAGEMRPGTPNKVVMEKASGRMQQLEGEINKPLGPGTREQNDAVARVLNNPDLAGKDGLVAATINARTRTAVEAMKSAGQEPSTFNLYRREALGTFDDMDKAGIALTPDQATLRANLKQYDQYEGLFNKAESNLAGRVDDVTPPAPKPEPQPAPNANKPGPLERFWNYGMNGGLLGNAVGGDTLSALIGGAGGALLGRSIDRGNVTCR